jgi:ABC-type glycerol-3-phosphate transport system substrate-binding protein
MTNIRPFQIITLAIFVVLSILAVLLLSGYTPSSTEEQQRFGERVQIWGTLPSSAFSEILDNLRGSDKAFEVVNYTQIDERNFNNNFVNAVAEGRSPDLLLISNTQVINNRNKLLVTSYESFPLRNFKDTYVDGAEVFALVDGIYAFPLGVDPLVMYWNRDIFSANGFSGPPSTWEEVISSTVPTLTKRDNNRNVLQASLAFGEMRNVQNAKEIVLLLALQSGSRMIYEANNQYQVALNQSSLETGLPPLEAAVQFYTNFNNSNTSLYTWNRSQSLDRNAFVSGDLALYFGFGSELATISTQNPNLNFDVTVVPQGASATVQRTYGRFYGFAIPRASQNVAGAYAVAQAFVRPEVSSALNDSLGLAPVSRTTIAAGTADEFKSVIFRTALIARGWLDPNPVETKQIIEGIIEDVTSARKSISASVKDGEQKIRLSF